MNLIANTGIQYFTFPLEINLSDDFKIFFHEWFDTDESQLKLELAHYFTDEDFWVKKWDLSYLGYVKEGIVKEKWENIKDDFYKNNKSEIKIDTDNPKDSGCFQMSINRLNWGKLENKWLPMPFFLLNGKKTGFGPTNWCRFKLSPTFSELKSKNKKYNLLLAFDTRTKFENDSFEEEDLQETPFFTNNYDKSKEYALCSNEYDLIGYFSEIKNCEWVDKFLLNHFHDIKDIKDIKGQKPKLDYLAQYFYLIRFILKQDILPKVTLFSNKNVNQGNVDLVVDIGNSRTCAVLFDNGDFSKSSPLELQDFSEPIFEDKLNKNTDSFEMRLAFREADFGGKFGIENSKQFVYPSLIRLGKEANKLIHKSTNLNTGAEKISTFSSPKRFLWDTKPQKQEWEFVQLEGEISKPIYIKGISEQLNYDGSLKTISNNDGFKVNYSRKALMTFAFIEILAQANMQINSFEQRKYWGNESLPRKIGKIIITCPTAMSRIEQINLRKCAEDASIILQRFFSETYDIEIEDNQVRENLNIIPSPKKISFNSENKDWIYDEATAAQFVFLYAEIGSRYLKNVKDYFDFYGKFRNDLIDYEKKSLTIGSVDIGAGTTDVMIASYKYNDNGGQCILTPIPLFWESFYKAGDDLIKEIIKQLVIEGKYSPIEQKMKTLNMTPNEIIDKNNDFYGSNIGMSFKYRQLRADFNLQVSVPIASFYLELIKQNKENISLTFNDVFSSNFPTKSVLNHFKHHFGFEFEELNWEFDRKVVTSIIEKTFETLIGKISSLFSLYACDIVLISGRPASLKPLIDLFLSFYAISPNRLKSMNDYRVGKWYPQDRRYRYVDGNGRFTNPKSIITTGAIIGNIAENGGLNGFVLNLKDLKEQLIPKTNFFGKLNEQLEYYDTIISPEINLTTIDVYSFPFRIGVRQLNISSYPSRPFYILDFNELKLEDRAQGRVNDINDRNAVQNQIDLIKQKILLKMPLKVTLSRDVNENLETLRIEEIINKDGDSENINFFSLQIQSMSEVDNFWLDTGIFSLNINTSNN